MNRQQLIRVALGLTFGFLLAACSQPRPTLTPTPDMTPGQVRGTLLDTNEQPVTGINLRLYRTTRSGEDAQGELIGGTKVTHFVVVDDVWVEVVDAGVETKTDSSGVFFFKNVPPGEYVPYAMFSQEATEFNDAEGEILVFTLLPGQVVNLTLQVQK